MMKSNQSQQIQDDPLIKPAGIQDQPLNLSRQSQDGAINKSPKLSLKSLNIEDEEQAKSSDDRTDDQTKCHEEHDEAHIDTHNEEGEAVIKAQNEEDEATTDTHNEKDEGQHEQQPINPVIGTQNEEQPIYPVSTHVQSVGNRQFELHIRTIHNLQLLILTFPRGLTLLMSALAANIPNQAGLAQLDVHRKFLPVYGKYLHWISFTFPTTGIKIKAQIMLETRLEAACQMIEGGAAACFLNNPLRTLRRSRNTRPRQKRSSR